VRILGQKWGGLVHAAESYEFLNTKKHANMRKKVEKTYLFTNFMG
jgi:hypothetical protein